MVKPTAPLTRRLTHPAVAALDAAYAFGAEGGFPPLPDGFGYLVSDDDDYFVSDDGGRYFDVLQSTAVGWGTATRDFGVRTDVAADQAGYVGWAGRAPAQVIGFANGTTWANIIAYARDFEALKAATYPVEWAIATPPGVTLAQIASGSQDAWLIELAGVLAAARPSDARIPVRPMWEFQLAHWAWCGVGQEAAYIAAWRRIVRVFLWVDDRFRFCWCPNHTTAVGGQPYDPALCYPGDEHVDVIGMDVYYIASIDGGDINSAWRFKQEAPFGLNWLTAFAAAHGKPIAIPEWGVNADNLELYISAMAEFLRANDTAYANYYDENTPDPLFQCRLDLDAYPATGARYKAEFGSTISPQLYPSADIAHAAFGVFNATKSGQSLLETVADGEHLLNHTLAKAASAIRYRLSFTLAGLGRDHARVAAFLDSYGTGAISYFSLATREVGSNFTYGAASDIEPFAIPLNGGVGTYGIEFTSSTGVSLLTQVQSALPGDDPDFPGDIVRGLTITDLSLRAF